MSEGNDQGGLQPLTLRQKVENRRFNKVLERGLGAVNALALGVLGYGGVKEALDALAGRSELNLSTLVVSILVGVGLEAAIAYFTWTFTRRED